MMVFTSATNAPGANRQSVNIPALVLAVLYGGLAVSQLFTFENFPQMIQNSFVGNDAASRTLAALIVTAEVFALPFLLRMPLSKAFRILSMLCGIIVAGFWLVILCLEAVDGPSESLLFGATIPWPRGWWNIGFGILLAGLAFWNTRNFNKAKE